MKQLIEICLLGIVTLGLSNWAEATLIVKNFEAIPDTYLFRSGAHNLDNYYSDLSFSPEVTVLDRGRSPYNDVEYPPHSGDAVIFPGFSYNYIKVSFVGFTSTYVETWYTCRDTIYMEAYDTYDNLLACTSAPANFPKVNSIISISCENIAYHSCPR